MRACVRVCVRVCAGATTRCVLTYLTTLCTHKMHRLLGRSACGSPSSCGSSRHRIYFGGSSSSRRATAGALLGSPSSCCSLRHRIHIPQLPQWVYTPQTGSCRLACRVQNPRRKARSHDAWRKAFWISCRHCCADRALPPHSPAADSEPLVQGCLEVRILLWPPFRLLLHPPPPPPSRCCLAHTLMLRMFSCFVKNPKAVSSHLNVEKIPKCGLSLESKRRPVGGVANSV